MRSGSMFCQPTRADRAKIDELCRFTRDKINDPQGGETERGEEDGTERHSASMPRAARRCNRDLCRIAPSDAALLTAYSATTRAQTFVIYRSRAYSTRQEDV